MHKTIIFDLDGTLAHTAPDLIATLNRVTASVGLEPVSMEAIGQLVGQGSKAMLKRAFALQKRDLHDNQLEELFPIFLADYTENIANESYLYPGVEKALDLLSEDGFEFCVCTNKPEGPARLLLNALGISQRFLSVTGGDTFEFKKPDPRHLHETLGLADRKNSQAIMIGDSINDIAAANAGGIKSVAVSFGYSDLPIPQLGATHIIDHFDELPPIAQTLAANR